MAVNATNSLQEAPRLQQMLSKSSSTPIRSKRRIGIIDSLSNKAKHLPLILWQLINTSSPPPQKKRLWVRNLSLKKCEVHGAPRHKGS